uniref:Uncharacterized protein n=1 Tax=Anopheles atroparvus TaxID=41427 RepID=A0AAG5D4Q7_ANOAO
MMADTNTSAHVPPAAASGGGVGGGNDPSVIPQWKKELIQRRKNLAKTIGAVATQVHDSASTVAAAISASSPVTPHPRTPTGGGAFPVGSPFYAGAGTKEGSTTHSSCTNTTNCGPLDTVPDSERQQLQPEPVVENEENISSAGAGTDKTDSMLLVAGTGGGVKQEDEPRMVAIAKDNNHCPSIPFQAATSPTAAGVHFGAHFGGANEPTQQQQQRSVGGSVRAVEAVLVPPLTSAASGSVSAGAANGPQSHSNAGSEHSGSSSSSCSSGSSTVAAAIAPATRPNSVPVSVDHREIPTVSNNNSANGVAKGSSLGSSSVGQQQQQQQRDGGAARKMVAATAAEEIVVVYEKSSVLDGTVVDVSGGGGIGGGGGGGAGGPGFGDAGEELKYGPGIVSRLRCRYLSLALRQSVTKQRPSLNSMRRATSLNNLLDEESEDLSEREQSIGSEGGGHQNHHHHNQQQQQQHQQQQQQQQQAQQKKYHSQNYHYQQQQQQQQQREHYANGNGNNHNHNHNHLHQQQQQPLHATVVLQPPYQKQQPQFAPKQPWIHQHQQEEQQQQQQVVKTAAPFLRGVQNSYTRASRQVEKKNEYNRYTKHHRGGGGADAVLLKRARSVEALVRYDHHKAWERDATGPPVAAAAAVAAPTGVAAAPPVAPPAAELVSSAELGSNVIILDEINVQAATTATNNGVVASTTTTTAALESNGISSSGPVSGAPPPTATAMMNGATRGGGGTDLPLLVSDCVTIEEKIINGREKGDPKPKRLTSFIDADERPPPDVVKQTMKIFEANANRRGGRANGATGGPPGSEVASKVANYRSIIISGSATATAGATTAAAAVSGEKPPITHPKPPLSPKKPNIKPRTASPKHQASAPTTAAGKPPPTPKSLEAVNNLKNSSIINNNNNNGSIIGSVTGQRNSINSKQQAPVAVAESVPLLSTPPSPPARSKHATPSTLVCSNGAASVGAVNKGMQSNGAGGGNEMGVTTHGVVECAPDAAANAVEAKNNALKNGGGCVRDHHNNYENGLTQTATVATASKTAGSDSGHQHMHNTAQGAAASSSPPLVGICESPSIQQLTSKLASLHLATSTPTGAGANGTTSPVSAASSAAQDRRNLEYVTSDEEEDDDEDDEQDGHHHTTSYTVNPDSDSEQELEEEEQQQQQHHPKDVRDGGVAAGSGNDADDDEDDASGGGEGEQENSDDDDDDDDRSVRKISRTAMENIARAGTTTQFRFNGAVKSSYLPGAAAVAASGGIATAAPSSKPPAPPIPKSRESLGAKSANGAATGNNEANGSAGRSPSEVAVGSMAINSAVNNGGALGGVGGGGGGAHNDGVGGGSPLTRREIEKNQINREKSGEAVASPAPVPNSLHGGSGGAFHNQGNQGGGGAGASVGGVSSTAGQKLATGNSSNSNGSSSSVSDSTTSFVAKWGTGGGGQSATAPATAASPLAGLVARKKTKPPPSQQDGTNTMVFNFSDRKDVPDYIENDGVIIRPRPRELPKPGESGFVVLGDLTLETSTDPDDAWAMGPPSPCNGEFANAYIVINGKSSMRNKTSRSNKFKIQFDDSLTSTYEYPSETSLLEPNGLDDADSGPDSSAGLVPPAFATDNGLLSHTNKLLSSVPLEFNLAHNRTLVHTAPLPPAKYIL